MGRTLLFAVSLALLWCCNDGYQFFLEGRTKRCFREDIPLSSDALFTYTIAQGPGAMPVSVRITDALGKEMYLRNEADRGVYTLHVPQRVPLSGGGGREGRGGRSARSNWALTRDDADGAEGADGDALRRQFPDAVGDNRLPYFFCFEHARALHLPRLSMYDAPLRRRVIFTLSYGAESKGRQFYDDLAKEKHLSSTEEMFHVVEDRVSDVIRKIEEMRQRERAMNFVTIRTSRSVVLYGVLACVAIASGAIMTSYSTLQVLTAQKGSR